MATPFLRQSHALSFDTNKNSDSAPRSRSGQVFTVKSGAGKQQNARQDPAYYAGLLKSSGNAKDLSEGKRLHSQILRSEYGRNKFLSNLLVEMYGKCGSVENARLVFDNIHQPNSYSWNIMISAYAQNGHLEEARRMFEEMPDPDVVAYTAMVTAYAQKGQVEEARKIFDRMPERNLVSWNALFAAYAHNGYLQEARKVFEKMPNRCVVSWTIMFAAYAREGHVEDAKNMFDKMPHKDLVSWNVMIEAYVKNGHLRKARNIFDFMPERDVVSWTAMVTAYAQNAELQEARMLFDKMPVRDMVSWTAMITGYAQNGQGKEAIRLFRLMDLEGMYINKVTFISVVDACAGLAALAEGRIIHANIVENGFEKDVNLATALVYMYGKCAKLQDAQNIFDKIQQRDVVLWNAMITVYAQTMEREEAVKLFEAMGLEGMQPDDVTFIGILSACSHAGRLEDGWSYFVSISLDYGMVPTRDHYICMADLLGRAGRLDEAEELISCMPYSSDVATWLTLLAACKTHNDAERGLRAAERVFELDPENVSSYVLLSNIYSLVNNKQEVANLRRVMERRGLSKLQGYSSIEVNGNVHEFAAGAELSHPQKQMISAELQWLRRRVKEAGYVPELKVVLLDVDDTKKEDMLWHHSDKIAMALGLIASPSGAPIRIQRNLRMCSDCHAASKFISKVVSREIVIRDPNRFHYFQDGVCSCGDYW